MYRHLAASVLLAFGLVPAARAGDEIYLRWDNCFGDGGVYNKTFACDTDSGTESIVGSFRLAQTAPQVTALETVVHFQASAPTLSPWWYFQSPGGCRPASLDVTLIKPATSVTCLDPWTTGSVSFLYDYPAFGSDPSAGRLRIVQAVPVSNPFNASAGQEIFTFRIRIDHVHTTGAPVCAGCADPVCIGWGSARIRGIVGSGSDRDILGADTPNNGSNVTWQPGGVASTWAHCSPTMGCETGVLCQSVTPTRRSTWGSIKSLYR